MGLVQFDELYLMIQSDFRCLNYTLEKLKILSFLSKILAVYVNKSFLCFLPSFLHCVSSELVVCTATRRALSNDIIRSSIVKDLTQVLSSIIYQLKTIAWVIKDLRISLDRAIRVAVHTTNSELTQ